MTAKELCERNGWKMICGRGEREVSGCYIGDLLSRVMGRCGENNLWITVQTSANMLAVAELAEAAAVLFPEDIQVSDNVRFAADVQGITLATCRETAFEAALALEKVLLSR